MAVVLADKNYLDIATVRYATIDIDLGDTNDFEMTMRREDYTADYQAGNLIYIPESEYGGIIGEIDTDTSLDTLTLKGMTWRGLLDKKIITPPQGQDYRTVTGELNAILSSLIDSEFSGLIVASTEDTGVSVSSYQFDRYTTLLEGLKKMLETVGYRLHIELVQRGGGRPNYVEVGAVPIVDYSSTVELSQNSRLNFRMELKSNGVNHLICLGKGELAQRQVVDLYVQADGSIGTTKFFTGLEEIVEVYDYSSADDAAVLTEQGIERLQSLMNSQTFEMNVEELDLDIGIGDIIGGRDYLTGFFMAQPIKEKVWRWENGQESKTYKVEGTK